MLPNDKAGLQTPHFLEDDRRSPYGFHAYIPPDYPEQNQPYPLLVFLHGVGERGLSLKNVLRNGPPKMIDSGKWRTDLHMIVISPQCHDTQWFPDQIHRFLNYLIEHYRVDRSAVYLTGLSMGGFGVFQYLENYSHEALAAAAVIICGGGDVANAGRINQVPVWAFHGDDDQVVPSIHSSEMIHAINAANPKVRAKLTIYPDTGHDSWTMTYDGSGMGRESREYDPFDINIYDWMMGFRR